MNHDNSSSGQRPAATIYLTTEEVSERYRGEITVGTLANWRALKIGPPYAKIGKAILYPVTELEAWEKKNMVISRESKVTVGSEREQG
jgi:hypothetical protein